MFQATFFRNAFAIYLSMLTRIRKSPFSHLELDEVHRTESRDGPRFRIGVSRSLRATGQKRAHKG